MVYCGLNGAAADDTGAGTGASGKIEQDVS